MGRSAKPGISFYRMDAGHIINKKIRLLFNEFDSEGYWIWSCLIDYGYGKWGYFFDMNDPDELELFASEYCKKKLSAIKEVITGCLRRGLFDGNVAQSFGILTSGMMQETFLVATSERRAKDTCFEMRQDWLLLDFSKETPRNIKVIPPKVVEVPGKTGILPPNNPQIRGEESREEERRREESNSPNGDGGDGAPPASAEEVWKGLERGKVPISAFLRQYKPAFIDPYVELWNIYAKERGKAQVSKVSDARRKKFLTRVKEKGFDFVQILAKAGKADDLLATGKWFTFDWILESEGNYLKVLEGNYDKPEAKQATGPEIGEKVIEQLYCRFLDGSLDSKTVNEKHCDHLIRRGLICIDEPFILQAVNIRIRNLTGTNQGQEIRMIEAYRGGSWRHDTDCKADLPNLHRVAKKLALYALFNWAKEHNLKSISDVDRKENPADAGAR